MDANNIMSFLDEVNADEVKLSAADEAFIFLSALQESCTPEEYSKILESATELEIYGLIPSAAALEAAKKIVYKQTKQMNLSREESKAAIRMAKAANSAAYKKYKRGREMMIEGRDEIYAHFKTKAKAEAKAIVNNSRKKASAMKSVTGRTVEQKMKEQVNKLNGK